MANGSTISLKKTRINDLVVDAVDKVYSGYQNGKKFTKRQAANLLKKMYDLRIPVDPLKNRD